MSWRRVKGHDALVSAFQNAWCRGRMAHAYLFAGPEGVGKKLFAVELAKALLCEGRDSTPLTPDPTPARGEGRISPLSPRGRGAGGEGETRLEACDRCPACLQVAAGTHPDFFLAGRPEDVQELPIDTVRDLSRNLSLKPARGRGKVAILDDADDLNDASANAFLKTLEEPPPKSTLILIGASAERQLATIVSRCQVVRFQPLPAAVLAELLRQQEWCKPTMIERLTRLSGGSLGQAQALSDPALWEFRRTLLAGFAEARPNSVALGKAWMGFAEEAGKESAHQRRRASLVLKLLIELFQDALAVSLGGEPRLAEPADLASLQALADRCGPERLLLVLERCLDADLHIDRRVQLVLALEALTDAIGVRVGV